MVCSKSVFNDLPELIYEIIQYLHNDHITLSSCILVNRLWCRIAIPLLWENPFSTCTKNCNFIEIYLQYLNEKDKDKLQEYGIKIHSKPSLLFNYPNFIKNINTCKIVYSIEKWISAFKRNQNKNLLPPIINTTLYNRSFLNDIDCFMMPEFDFIRRSEFNLPPISNLINFTTGSTQIQSPPQSIQLFQAVQSTQSQPTQSLQPQDITSLFKNGKKGLIYKLLFKLFIKYKANLHTFEIFLMKIKEYKYFNNVYDLILENPNFIRSIKNLKLAFYNKGTSNLPKIDSFITFLSSNCDSISTLYLQFQFRNNNNILIEKFSSRIIKSQKNIKRIFFIHNNFSLNSSLLSLKNFYYSNNLKTITFFDVNFKNINIIKEVFEQFNVLESIHILYCQFINSFIKQIVQITGPFKLRSLFLDKIVKLNSLNSLLQKSGNYLENFGLGTVSKDESKRQLLELIIKYCKNIQFFDLPEFDDQNNLYLALDLIKILDQNLNYLSIEFFELNLNSKKISSILLQELGQLLPFKLEYLKLSLIINVKDFQIFLLNSQNTFIKKFLIKNKIKLEGFDNILSLIEDYIVKMRKVKYLALKEDFIEGRDLFLLKDHVKKFDLYNIKVQSYNDLDAYNGYKHVKETYY
ncbi:hypothetical protein RclHR1_03600008 [Rhizophagus clarus]|uniref:F-box domain-containing protein n=1 Tax=Rhizophagus clarus TaxID=94130 RepID=A0A2Z6RFC6_9GLOM|nr:hypothetical protein RclHR1_03600008 [Rhizophagus clarus]